ncbi:hypothetical protein Rsub_10205 [Raphidocelis subcapitata]|uniref:Uncharacterized protein n=1 Tax=Raphidocelis subcapitata TaxID=307507 RepID=A0A2V0PIQ0_9CHLO|nr:hypothetical protein Rsub_10205 [Raphidocelis subcapitata]|eukprot:GBF97780.1 hypothetical protein Rsub_10205 [Raphidocelis subcapitata]
MGKDEFVAYWRDTIHKAAVLAHQQDWDAGAREELNGVLTLYKVSLMPFMVLLSCALLRPAQLAAFYVQSWPWMPVLTPILEALEERRANDRGVTGTAGAAATAGATAGAAPS